MKTTLNKIRAHKPCTSGWAKLLKNLNKKQADDEPISILTILNSNGLDDALWCLRAVEGYEKEMRLYAVWCARQVQHLMKDPRSINALDVAERHAHGQATDDDLAAAWAAAAWAAQDASGDASGGAARDAARAAAWAAERDAQDASGDAARAAAWAAERDAQDAAWGAAWGAARDAARAAALAAQDAELRRVLAEIEAHGIKENT